MVISSCVNVNGPGIIINNHRRNIKVNVIIYTIDLFLKKFQAIFILHVKPIINITYLLRDMANRFASIKGVMNPKTMDKKNIENVNGRYIYPPSLRLSP